MRHLVVLVPSSLGGEEAVLAHVEVEALEAAVAEAHDGTRLADVALRLVPSRLSRDKTVEDWQPNHRLRFLFHPI